jgi:hypothetical protein
MFLRVHFGELSSKISALFWVTLTAAPAALAQSPAFPGALGFGADATGGRNGTVYHVTTLADSGPGSFRDAVSHPNRTIVFDVGGTIVLSSAVSCSSDLTIAGQTAPGGGIALIGHEVSFSARTNEIVRYLRIRPGSLSSSGEDAINVGDGTNMIFDHLSLEFAGYNNIDAHGTYGSDTITVQNSIIGDPMYNGTSAKQGFGAHTEHLGGKFSWYYNLWVSEHNRQPLAKIDTIFVNNTIYNFQDGYTVANTSGHFRHDIIGNCFITGPADPSGADAFFQMNSNQTIYAAGNLRDNNNDGALNGSPIDPGGGGTVLTAPWSPLSTNATVFSAAGAYHYDASWAGAMPRDPLDSLILSQIETFGNGPAGTGAGTAGPGPSLYYDQTSTGLGNNGYGSPTAGTAPINSSGDGIPDYWKLAIGLNTNVYYPPTNTADGYTLLEHYLNWLAAPHAATETNTALDIDLSQYAAGFAPNGAYTVSDASNGVVSLAGPIAQFVPDTNFSGLGGFNFSVTAGDGSSMSNTVVVCVSPLIVTQAMPSVAQNIFVALRTSATGPSTVNIPAPAGSIYSAAAPVPGTTWNTVDLQNMVGTNSAAGTVSNLYVNLPLVNSIGAGITPTLTIAYTNRVSTGTRTQPSGASGENTIQPGGVMANAWRNYYNASGNDFIFAISGLSNASPYDLYIEGGTTASGQGAGVTLAAANISGPNPAAAVTTNATANSNGAYGSLWTAAGGTTTLMPQGTTWAVLHGQTDASGNFSFLLNGPGGSAYLNGFQIVPASRGPAVPVFKTVTRAADGNIQFAYAGPAGWNYRIWAATNLSLTPVTNTWTTLTNGIFGTTDSFEDSQSANFTQRFYLITVP